MSLKSFLVSLKKSLDENASLRFVSGNQSADLDSVVSALSFAYLDHRTNPSSSTVPLINIPRTDLKLRRDIVALLNSHSITSDLLYFPEDFTRITNGRPADLILVDHCNLQGTTLINAHQSGKLKVVSIIDHHADENVFLDANPRIITPSGSCSSLVYNYFAKSNDLSEESEITSLLLAPLLIDTSNMSQKVESHDTEAFASYKKILTSIPALGAQAESVASDQTAAFQQYYEYIKSCKKDLSGFSLAEILRKDYKQFEFSSGDVVGFSSIGKSIKWVLSNFDNIQQTFSDTLKELGVDLLIITSSYTQKESRQYTRELAFYYEDTSNARFNALGDAAAAPLELNENVYQREKVEDKIAKLSDEKHVFRVYNQAKLSASRKQVVPAVKEILEGN